MKNRDVQLYGTGRLLWKSIDSIEPAHFGVPKHRLRRISYVLCVTYSTLATFMFRSPNLPTNNPPPPVGVQLTCADSAKSFGIVQTTWNPRVIYHGSPLPGERLPEQGQRRHISVSPRRCSSWKVDCQPQPGSFRGPGFVQDLWPTLWKPRLSTGLERGAPGDSNQTEIFGTR